MKRKSRGVKEEENEGTTHQIEKEGGFRQRQKPKAAIPTEARERDDEGLAIAAIPGKVPAGEGGDWGK